MSYVMTAPQEKSWGCFYIKAFYIHIVWFSSIYMLSYADMDTFDDNQLFSLLDSENEREKEKDAGMQRALEIDRQLWEAVDLLDVATVIGPDYSKHDEYYNSLFRLVYEECETTHGATLSEAELVDLASGETEKMWTTELALLSRLQISMSQQQFPSDPTDLRLPRIKKEFMADLIAEKHDTEIYFPLVDYVLSGEKIDIDDADDIALIHEKVEAILTIDTSPPSVFFDRIKDLFGIPEDLENISPRTPEVIEHISNRLYAGRDITIATHRLSDSDNQPNRHEAIYSILRNYGIDDTQTTDAIIRLSDEYTQ